MADLARCLRVRIKSGVRASDIAKMEQLDAAQDLALQRVQSIADLVGERDGLGRERQAQLGLARPAPGYVRRTKHIRQHHRVADTARHRYGSRREFAASIVVV